MNDSLRDPKLLAILRKAQGEGSPLDPGDRAYLADLLALGEAAEQASAPRPLRALIRDNLARDLCLPPRPWVDLELGNATTLLQEAGAHAPLDTPLQRAVALVSPVRLRSVIDHHLQGLGSRSGGEVTDAIVLAGLVGHAEGAPQIKKILRSQLIGKSKRDDSYDSLINASIMALRLLGDAPALTVHEILASDEPYAALGSPDEVKSALLAPHLRTSKGRAAIASHLEAGLKLGSSLLGGFADEIAELCDSKAMLAQVRAWSGGTLTRGEAEGLARILVKRKQTRLIKKALVGDNDELRNALLIEVAEAGQSEHTDLIRGWYDEHSDDINAAMALGRLGSDVAGMVDAAGYGDEWPRGAGLLAGCAGRPELRWLLERCARSSRTECNDTARLLLAAPAGASCQAHLVWLFDRLVEPLGYWAQLHLARALARAYPWCDWMPGLCKAHHDEVFAGLPEAMRAHLARSPGLAPRGTLARRVLDAVGSREGLPGLRGELEASMIQGEEDDESRRRLSDLMCQGGPVTEAGEARANQLLGRPLPRGPREMARSLSLLPSPASSFEFVNRMLDATPAELCEPLLCRYLLAHSDIDDVGGILDRISALHEPGDPWLRAVQALMRRQPGSIDELPSTLLQLRSSKIQVPLLALLEGTPEHTERERLLLLQLASGTGSEIETSAARLLLAKNTDQRWTHELLRHLCFSDEWITRRWALQQFAHRATLEDARLLWRMLEDSDNDVRDAALDALKSLAEREPRPGLRVIPLRYPGVVGWTSGGRPSDCQENRKQIGAEWAGALQQASNPKEAARHQGRALVLSRLKLDERPHAGQREALARLLAAPPVIRRPVEEFALVAAHLKINSIDADKGTIEAQVTDRVQSPAVQRRLLQDFFIIEGTLIAFQASWKTGASE